MGVRRVGRQPRVSPEGRPRRDLPSGATAPSSQLLATSSRPLETRAEEDDRKAEERHAGRSSWPASEPKREEGERRVRAEEARVRRLRAEVEAWREAAHVRTYLDALLRSWLRDHYPRRSSERGSAWSLTDDQVEAARAWQSRRSRTVHGSRPRPPAPSRRPRSESDADYVLDLCDELLGERSSREHTFPWLLGDPGRSGARRQLPVDAYYPEHKLVIEYRERQHDEPVSFFDKPERMTVSGVHRGEQRRRYDDLRDREIPAHALVLLGC